ncbi:DNA-(apurinic or apyrimidinic site) endonuclease, chloroplastic isoform X2 [Typha latifolia]|uniref:DNA-(apurinic or apyrimidinic site) endonuclease, chloroplastic isoform X2 n=1 Tax=Typha latifolia TaxID=4733 RepID=UPI003C2F0413
MGLARSIFFTSCSPPLCSWFGDAIAPGLFYNPNVSIFWLQKRNLRAGGLVLMKSKGIRSEMRYSSSSGAVSTSIDSKKDAKFSKGSEDVMENYAEIEDIRRDPDRLHKMTVKELRTLTRKVGVSAKGSKKDLVSALMRSSVKSDDGLLSMGETMLSSGTERTNPRNPPSKRKAKVATVDDNAHSSTTVAEVTSMQKRSRRKKQSVESVSVESDSGTHVTLNDSSTKEEEIIDVRRGRKWKEDSVIIQRNEGILDQVGLPMDHVEPWTIFAHKKPQAGWIPYNPKTMRPPPLSRDTKFVKLVSWNVNGLRALLRLKTFSALQLAQREDFDVLCLQETKIQEKDVEEIKETLIKGYDSSFWTCSVSKLGYSGCAIISRIKPISVVYGLGIPDHDSEGRLVTVEFEKFYLISGYVPNSGDGLRRLSYRIKEWDPSLSSHMKELEKSKPVILTGDLNCAHQEIDIYNPAGNRRSAGFTNEERESFEMNFLSKGFVDTFRKQHPGVVGYTYWGYRHGGRKTNKGWRLDYFLVSESLADQVYDSYILPDVTGSDHSPIGLILKI